MLEIKKLSKSNRKYNRKHYQHTQTEGKIKSEIEHKDEEVLYSNSCKEKKIRKTNFKNSVSQKLKINKEERKEQIGTDQENKY